MVTKNKSFALTAEVEVPEGRREGVIVAQGGAFGGWSSTPRRQAGLLLQPLRPPAVQGLRRRAARARRPGGAGVRVRRRRAGEGGGASLYVDGEKVGQGRVDATVPMLFSADETTDLGTDSATPVTDDLGPNSRVHRPCALGRDRPRRRRGGRRPPDPLRGALPDRAPMAAQCGTRARSPRARPGPQQCSRSSRRCAGGLHPGAGDGRTRFTSERTDLGTPQAFSSS